MLSIGKNAKLTGRRWATAAAAALLLASLVSTCTAADMYYSAQSQWDHSTLITYPSGKIHDWEFASWVQSLLIVPGGGANCKDAKFLFQQCYGGGMLDDLDNALGTTVTWVGGSASKHDEVSWSVMGVGGYWTKELITGMGTLTYLIDGINYARANDPIGVNGTGEETGQSIFRNLGDTIELADTSASSHHAILFVGDPTDMSYYYDIEAVRNKLISKWGQPNGAQITIDVLFGDGVNKPDNTPLPLSWGAISATKGNLQNAISALANQMDSTEQFFFYSSDHGGWWSQIVYNGPVLPALTVYADHDLPPGAVHGMALEDDNTPTETMSYDGVTEPNTVQVCFNGAPIGFLPPGSGMVEFPVPEDLIVTGPNTISVFNGGPGPVMLHEFVFDTGGIGVSEGTVAAAKAKQDGESVKLTFPSLTSMLGNAFYVESYDRTSGIRIEQPPAGLALGQQVDILGCIMTNLDGERCIQPSRVLPWPQDNALKPLYVRSGSIGGGDWLYSPPTNYGGQEGVKDGAGLNNIGLLVRTCGKVTARGSGYFYIDDGSNLADGTYTGEQPNLGIRVTGVDVTYPDGTMVVVTGVSSCFKPDNELRRQILVSGPGDVTPL